jgi:cytidylate kinase
VAGRLGFVYINTGAMYRAVALWALRNGTALDDMHRLERLAQEAKIEFGPGAGQIFLNGEDVTPFIHTPEVAVAASKVSAVPGVRRALIPLQRSVAEKNSVVMEGRDIGSVVFPEAQVKIFLDAKPEERARRRAAELQDQIAPTNGEAVGVESVATEMRERDIRDRGRSESPLVQAPDAHLLDTTGLSVDEVEEEILRLVRTRTSNGKEAHR